jgi:hypothetical protein
MPASDSSLPKSLARIFAELVDGPRAGAAAFMLNSGDLGLLGSLDRVSAPEASQAIAGGATVAAHAQHLRYGLSLMNEWATEGGNPFANAKWDEAWRVSSVSPAEWDEIRSALNSEVRRWGTVLGAPRELQFAELCGMIGSIAHLAYHLGAIRQIAHAARGPREGTFATPS